MAVLMWLEHCGRARLVSSCSGETQHTRDIKKITHEMSHLPWTMITKILEKLGLYVCLARREWQKRRRDFPKISWRLVSYEWVHQYDTRKFYRCSCCNGRTTEEGVHFQRRYGERRYTSHGECLDLHFNQHWKTRDEHYHPWAEHKGDPGNPGVASAILKRQCWWKNWGELCPADFQKIPDYREQSSTGTTALPADSENDLCRRCCAAPVRPRLPNHLKPPASIDSDRRYSKTLSGSKWIDDEYEEICKECTDFWGTPIKHKYRHYDLNEPFSPRHVPAVDPLLCASCARFDRISRFMPPPQPGEQREDCDSGFSAETERLYCFSFAIYPEDEGHLPCGYGPNDESWWEQSMFLCWACCLKKDLSFVFVR